MKDSQQLHLAQIYEKLINDEASVEEIEEFEQAIMNDPDALELYQDLSNQHSYLQSNKGKDAVTTTQARRSKKLKSTITTLVAYTSVAAAVVLGMMLLFPSNKPSNQLADKPNNAPSYATLSSSSLAQWGQCSLPTQLNEKLAQGNLELLKGTATLTFDSGAMVTLEAPAEIEIVSGMKAIVRHGRVVADVPKAAIGFRLDTPDMEVKDLGTVFAVSVDRNKGESQVDVLDGEVEIFHQPSQDRKLLLVKQRASVAQNSDTVEYSTYGEITRPNNTLDANKHNQEIISTADGKGGHASIISDHASTHLYPNLLQAKHSVNGSYSRKFYLKFDISQLSNKNSKQISLQLNQVRSPYGFASFVPDCEFRVYALTDESMENWDPKTLTWKNAPANLQKSGSLLDEKHSTLVGSFSIPRGQQEGVCNIGCSTLSELIKQDTNGSLTLVVARKTRETRMEGLVHTFAGNETKDATPPQLIFSGNHSPQK